MKSAAAASYRAAAELPDYEEDPVHHRQRLHCEHCGAFLRGKPDSGGYHPEYGHNVWTWGCGKCGRQHEEYV